MHAGVHVRLDGPKNIGWSRIPNGDCFMCINYVNILGITIYIMRYEEILLYFTLLVFILFRSNQKNTKQYIRISKSFGLLTCKNARAGDKHLSLEHDAFLSRHFPKCSLLQQIIQTKE